MLWIVRPLHLALALVAAPLWASLALGSLLLVGVALAGHRLWPQADWGDCWSYALPRWALHGGALQISIHRVDWVPIPRATWVRPDGWHCRAEPVQRAQTARELRYGVGALYFRYRPKTYLPRVAMGTNETPRIDPPQPMQS